jgi:hypothetical protein
LKLVLVLVELYIRHFQEFKLIQVALLIVRFIRYILLVYRQF